MNMQDIIAQAGGIESIARELNVDEATAQSGAQALLPAILGGFKGQAQASPQGLGGLPGLLQNLGGGGLQDNVLQPGASDVGAGNNVLSQIFGSKDVSRTVASNAATNTGLSPDLLQKMLPLLAMLVTGYMAKQAGGGQTTTGGLGGSGMGSGGLGGMLGSVLGGLTGGGGQQVPGGMAGGLGGMLGGGGGGMGGLGGLASMLDFDRDGNPLDDIMGMAGRMGGR